MNLQRKELSVSVDTPADSLQDEPKLEHRFNLFPLDSVLKCIKHAN
jgi:hypothetical protein